jgi:hypothetical protein
MTALSQRRRIAEHLLAKRAGAIALADLDRVSLNELASQSRIAPNTEGESWRGRHNHSTLPLGGDEAHDSQSKRKA